MDGDRLPSRLFLLSKRRSQQVKSDVPAFEFWRGVFLVYHLVVLVSLSDKMAFVKDKRSPLSPHKSDHSKT
ncbi:MAG: hypothetical protein PUP93_05090 [Rhizonema sp. NSF051]|nr:hypothetical protein [Rhizonema sp. NSF051]